ncbi:MAG: NAD(P)-binding protein, partial [Clostridiales Family XIII bacterium]|nr:NAD(P)-binding protein [Clostridiales Family XIII bacterium]
MKKLDDYLPSFDSCRLSEPPFCRAVCPFHLDVAGFVGKVWAGAYSAAYRIYRDAVCFPRVVSEICPAPCRDACPLGQVRQEGAQAGAEPGGAVDLPLLERRAVDEAGGTPPNDYNIPVRGGRVAVVGAGLSGLGCALRLATRKYRVEIFEKTDRIGGADLAGMEQGVREACLRDIKAQFGNEDYELHLGHEVASIDDLTGQGFDAVYIATGSGGADFGFARGGSTEPAAAPGVGKCVVCGGALVGDGGVYALAAGLNMAVAIDGWFKTGKLSIAEDEYKTCAELHPMTMALAARRAAAQQAAGRKPARRTPGRRGAGSGGAGGMEEGGALGHSEPARLEAARCIECKCNACELFCDLIGYTGKQPPRIREEVFATTLPGASEVKHLPAKRLMHLCTQCGVCKEVCP